VTTVVRRARGGGGAGAAVLALAVLAAVVTAPRTPVTAGWNAQVAAAPSVIALTSLGPAVGLSATPAGSGVALTWSPGRNGAGYRVAGAGADPGGGCGAAGFAPLLDTAALGATVAQPAGPPGTTVCYRVETVLGPWTSLADNPVVGVRVGHVVAAVTAENGGVVGKLDVGDRFAVRFNQPVDPTTGPGPSDTVCATPSGAIVLAATRTAGRCTAGEANRLGQLDGGALSHNVRWSASYGWSDGDRLLLVTLTAKVAGPNALFTTGPWTLTPTSTPGALRSATGGVALCASDGGGARCRPVTSGSV
jgi:hypothetical protein